MNRTKKVVISGLCLSLCMVLPFLTGQIPQIGQVIAPMHIPVLLCGLLCGPLWGGLIGFIAPALRFVLFQAPPLMPVGISMMFELATYGIIAGLIYKNKRRKKAYLLFGLISAMILGRIIWGVVMFLISGYYGWQFTFNMFFMQAFVTALPGIIVHCILIPPIVILLERRADIYE